MEIQLLRMHISQQELSALAAEAAARHGKVRDLAVRLTPEGAAIEGVYHVLVGIPFETLWHLSIDAGQVVARLDSIKVARMGASMFKGLLLNAIGDAIGKVQGVTLEQETLRLDLDRLLTSKGFPTQTNLTQLQCGPGYLLIEAGTSR